MASQDYAGHVSTISGADKSALQDCTRFYKGTIDELIRCLNDIVLRPDYDKDVVRVKDNLDATITSYQTFLVSYVQSSAEDAEDARLLLTQLEDLITICNRVYRTYQQRFVQDVKPSGSSSHRSRHTHRTRSSRKSAKLLAEARLIEIAAEEKELLAQIELDKQRAESHFMKRKAQALREAASSRGSNSNLNASILKPSKTESSECKTAPKSLPELIQRSVTPKLFPEWGQAPENWSEEQIPLLQSYSAARVPCTEAVPVTSPGDTGARSDTGLKAPATTLVEDAPMLVGPPCGHLATMDFPVSTSGLPPTSGVTDVTKSLLKTSPTAAITQPFVMGPADLGSSKPRPAGPVVSAPISGVPPIPALPGQSLHVASPNRSDTSMNPSYPSYLAHDKQPVAMASTMSLAQPNCFIRPTVGTFPTLTTSAPLMTPHMLTGPAPMPSQPPAQHNRVRSNEYASKDDIHLLCKALTAYEEVGWLRPNCSPRPCRSSTLGRPVEALHKASSIANYELRWRRFFQF